MSRPRLRTFDFPLPGTRNAKGEPLMAEIEYSWQNAEHDVGIEAGPIIEGININGYGIDDFIEQFCDCSNLREKIAAACPDPGEPCEE